MNRSTKKDKSGRYYLTGDGIYSDYGVPEKFYGDDVDNLGVIEDILGDDYSLDRLRELVKADKDGRVVKFRFRLGSNVYRIWTRPDGKCPFISKYMMKTIEDLANAESWKNAYETLKQAEEALEKRTLLLTGDKQ